MKNLGYGEELQGQYDDLKLRPDFVKNIGSNGIILEVERGKTLDNNMDFLDFWKCHIHPRYSYLILLVPIWYKSNSTDKSPKQLHFSTVCKHYSYFYRENNYTNVKGTVVIGY